MQTRASSLTYFNNTMMQRLLLSSLAALAMAPLPGLAMGQCDDIGDWQQRCACMWPRDEAGIWGTTIRYDDGDWLIEVYRKQWERLEPQSQQRLRKIIDQCASPDTEIFLDTYNAERWRSHDGTHETGVTFFSSPTSPPYWD